MNMFAYCLGNPVDRTDPAGALPKEVQSKIAYVALDNGCGAGSAGIFVGATLILGSFVRTVVSGAAKFLDSALSDVYEYSASLQDSSSGFFANHQPRVHHIVPWGAFSNRKTHQQVIMMQTILTEVGIDPKTDPLNLIIVSHGYHKSLHTDAYLSNLYNSLKPARGNRQAIEQVLYYARIVIAFGDPYARGY